MEQRQVHQLVRLGGQPLMKAWCRYQHASAAQRRTSNEGATSITFCLVLSRSMPAAIRSSVRAHRRPARSSSAMAPKATASSIYVADPEGSASARGRRASPRSYNSMSRCAKISYKWRIPSGDQTFGRRSRKATITPNAVSLAQALFAPKMPVRRAITSAVASFCEDDPCARRRRSAEGRAIALHDRCTTSSHGIGAAALSRSSSMCVPERYFASLELVTPGPGCAEPFSLRASVRLAPSGWIGDEVVFECLESYAC